LNESLKQADRQTDLDRQTDRHLHICLLLMCSHGNA